MDEYGHVPRLALHLEGLLYHRHDGAETGAEAVRLPAVDVELSHLVGLLGLHRTQASIGQSLSIMLRILYLDPNPNRPSPPHPPAHSYLTKT